MDDSNELGWLAKSGMGFVIMLIMLVFVVGACEMFCGEREASEQECLQDDDHQ